MIASPRPLIFAATCVGFDPQQVADDVTVTAIFAYRYEEVAEEEHSRSANSTQNRDGSHSNLRFHGINTSPSENLTIGN